MFRNVKHYHLSKIYKSKRNLAEGQRDPAVL